LALIAADGAVGQDVHVELGVLADLEFVRVFQDRLERAQHGVAVQLLGHADVGVGQRDVGRFVGLHGERQADQLRLLRVDAGGFGVEGEQLGVVQFLQPDVETRLIEDGFVRGFEGRRALRLARAEQIASGAGSAAALSS
jgi:hypothetical protein